MNKQSNLYCPLHGTQLQNEKDDCEAGGIFYTTAECKNKGGKHKVYVEDGQAVNQDGRITISLS